MFTGIIETTGYVLDITNTSAGARLTIDISGLGGTVNNGDSIAINGVCLTAVNPSKQQSVFDVVKETLDKTNFSQLASGSKVNLERAMGMNSRFDGHFVQGHIDSLGTISNIIYTDEEVTIWISHDPDIRPLIVPKGSITINGISLTIADTKDNSFCVAVIPTTLNRTNLRYLQSNDTVNLETDILARTIQHQIKNYLLQQAGDSSNDINQNNFLNTLRNQGFT